MSTILSLYCDSAFKEFLLPAVNNANYSITISKVIFGLDKSLELMLEIVDNKWSFISSPEYGLSCEGISYFGQTIRDGDLVRLTINGENRISILVRESDHYFNVYRKYILSNLLSPITIGKNKGCTIFFDALGLVSGNHASIRRSDNGVILEDTSTNGVFVNNLRIRGSANLRFGDCIDIYGLRLVFLGEILAVNTADCQAIVSESLAPCHAEGRGGVSHGKRAPKIFHRSPRHIARLETEPVEIDAVPAPKDLDQPSLLGVIGPSLTMALPMLLGCSLMIYSSRASGISTGPFMYTGLVTALSSALIGCIWAVSNARHAKQKHEKEIALRDSAYREYLIKKEKDIADKYSRNSMALLSRYSSAEECVRYDETNQNLWNRNVKQEDFLTHRIGLGRELFQVSVVIPKEHFAMISDDLMEMPKRIRDKYQYLAEVPVCINLMEKRLIGVIGGKGKIGAALIVHNIISQIAANNCYTDVKLLIIYDEKEDGLKGNWDFAKWLPHVWNENKTFRYVADNKSDASDVFYELAQVLRVRSSEETLEKDKNKIPKPYYILILASMDMLEGELVSRYVLDPRPEYGLSTIMLVENYEELPNECEEIIENDNGFAGVYNIFDDLTERKTVRFDITNSDMVNSFSRRIADIEVRELETGGEIPNVLSFFDMFGVTKLSEFGVIERWRKNRTYESLKAIIGYKSGNVPCYLDVHEKYHGPHGLVAGTTGSGKSEILQTYILSLAINFSPDDVGFFLIDYKGGGMAGLFDGLPHLMGQISNLSGNQIRRAMVSIKSENIRRQRIFNEYGVNNINSYTRLYKNNEAKTPVPHLFIVIDEFAELKREEPDFMRELISVAQVGRSLGVHLILATQKPSGTVDDNIWSNSKFRLCLRVQDRQDSNDMLHRPDAAYIIQAGRCYLQVGNDELFELFQSGWSGAYYSEDDNSKSDIAKMISITGRAALEGNRTKIRRIAEEKHQWIRRFVEVLDDVTSKTSVTALEGDNSVFTESEFCNGIFAALKECGIDYPYSEYNAKRVAELFNIYEQIGAVDDIDTKTKLIIEKADEHHRRLPEKKEKTQLEAVVEFLGKMARSNGYENSFQLWMPVLPQLLYLDELPGYCEGSYDGSDWVSHDDAWTLSVEIGKYDDPENQSQGPLILDQSKNGHMAVCGTITTGKSTFLQTYIFALINRFSPAELNLYILDFSSKMLSAYEGSVHVGGVMYENDDKKIEKFFTMMGQILKTRKGLFRGGNYGQYVRASGKIELPSIVVVIDNYGNFRNKTGGVYDDAMMELAKDGVSYGIFLVITGAGFSMNEIPAKFADNLRTVISLEMNDRFQYGEVLRMLHVPVYPETGVKGRGLAYVGETVLEFQTALCLRAEDDFKRSEYIAAVCEKMRGSWKGKIAGAIPEIPAKPLWSEYIAMDGSRNHLSSGLRIPIGYEERYATSYGLDLRYNYTWLITGKTRTGKTNMLKIAALSAKQAGGKVVFIDFTDEFEDFAERIGAERITDTGGFNAYFDAFLPSIKERNELKHKLEKENLDEDGIYERMQVFEKVFFMIGHMGKFISKAYNPDQDTMEFGGFLENLLDKGYLQNYFWFGVYDQEKMPEVGGRKAWDHFIRSKRGIHFGGNAASQRVFSFDDLPYTEQAKHMKTGHGLIPPVDDETGTTTLVIPLADV